MKIKESQYLSECGLLIWKHKTNKRLFLERGCSCFSRITLVDETTGIREVIDSFKFSTFDFRNWKLLTKEEYSKVENLYKDIYK